MSGGSLIPLGTFSCYCCEPWQSCQGNFRSAALSWPRFRPKGKARLSQSGTRHSQEASFFLPRSFFLPSLGARVFILSLSLLSLSSSSSSLLSPTRPFCFSASCNAKCRVVVLALWPTSDTRWSPPRLLSSTFIHPSYLQSCLIPFSLLRPFFFLFILFFVCHSLLLLRNLDFLRITSSYRGAGWRLSRAPLSGDPLPQFITWRSGWEK